MRLIRFWRFCIFLGLCAFLSIDAFAAGGYSVGGLTIVNKKNISVVSQDLYLSLGRVKSTYIFKNTSNEDIITEINFIVPAVEMFPSLDEAHPQDFEFFYFDTQFFPATVTTIDGDSEFDDFSNGSVCIKGVDYCYENESYHWRQVFKPGKEVKITVQYTPAVDSEFGLISNDEVFCPNEGYSAALHKRYDNGFTSWKDYYLRFSPANELGVVGDFRLVVDKGESDALVSFCGENVNKISPTKFEMRKTNYTPPEAFQILISGGFYKE